MKVSVAERQAMLLEGEAVALGDSVAPIDRYISPAMRIAAMAFTLSHTGLVFSHKIAAWIHGCGPFPRTIDLTVQPQHRYGFPDDPRVRIRRFRLHFTRDVQTIADARVTTPHRTAVHLLTDQTCDSDSLTSAALLAGGMEPLVTLLERAQRIKASDRARALQRLETIQPLVTL